MCSTFPGVSVSSVTGSVFYVNVFLFEKESSLHDSYVEEETPSEEEKPHPAFWQNGREAQQASSN